MSAALRRVLSSAALAVSKLRADSCQETNGRLFSRQRERERESSREVGAVISGFVGSSFAKLRTTVLQRRKNNVLCRQLPLDVALRFAAPLVARLHASVYVEGKLSAFWCRPSLSHYRETCFRDPRKQCNSPEQKIRNKKALARFIRFARTTLRPGVNAARFFSRSHVTK